MNGIDIDVDPKLEFSRKCHIDRSLLNTQHYENEKLFVGIVGLRSAVWSLPQR